MDELYVWLESYGGTSYDLTSTIYSIEATLPFVSPFDWRTSIENVLDQMDEAVDIIEKYGKNLPDNLPSKQIAKRMFVMDVLSKLVENVRAVCREMGLDIDDITTIDKLRNVVLAMSELIDMFINNTIETIQKEDLFEKHEDDNDDSFQNILDVDERDIVQLSYNVAQIRDTYFMSLDDDSDEQ
jgi:antitoxin component of RelBE/YafQ-DinJ toxin-antitoxin module